MYRVSIRIYRQEKYTKAGFTSYLKDCYLWGGEILIYYATSFGNLKNYSETSTYHQDEVSYFVCSFGQGRSLFISFNPHVYEHCIITAGGHHIMV